MKRILLTQGKVSQVSNHRFEYLNHGKKWQAKIKVNKKSIHLYTWNTEKEAANAYNEAAKKHHGEFAKINK